MSPPKSINDSDWPEVRFINGYAMFIGFLRMGVRGLSVLVFTWATVVLLGGFVSDMVNTDFWCLTMITLIQTFSAGVFDSILKEGSSNSNNSRTSLFDIASTVFKDMPNFIKEKIQLSYCSKSRKVIIFSYFLWMVQLLMLVTVWLPLLVVYVAGLYICTGISLWRLIWHVSDNANRGSNQRPALVVLYSLTVAQCALHGFKELYAWVKGNDLVKEVADSYSMDKHLVHAYFLRTMIGCKKDPTFSRRRNLVTYAVDLLMESRSNESYLSGVQILGTLLKLPLRHFTISGQPDLIKDLLIESASRGHMIQRLIETMGTESSDSRKIREHAASIVAHIGDEISLRYFPGGTKFLCFLLNTVKSYRGPSVGSSGSWLVVQCLRIIQNLTAVEDNCIIIIKIVGLMSKTAAPLIFDKLHDDHHDKWSEVAVELLKLMSRLMATPVKRGKKLRLQMSHDNNAIISALGRRLACPECEVLVIRSVIQVFLDLSMDPSDIMDQGGSSMKFTWIMLHIFLLPDDCFDRIRGSTYWTKRSPDIRRLAGQRLLNMLHLRNQGCINNMFESVGFVLDDLTGALADAGNISSRVRAAEILDHLCHHYISDDGYLCKLKEAMVVVMPNVISQSQLQY